MDNMFKEEDDGDFLFADDVKEPGKIERFLRAAGDVNYVPIPLEGEGPYPDLEETMLTLLHWAAWYKEVDTVKLLIQYGAKVESKDVKGKTALDLAKQQGAEKDIIALLSTTNRRASMRLM